MARPAFGYRNAAGEKIPGSTSVLKHIQTMDSDILCNWAAKLAKKGQDWRAYRKSAGEKGTALHELCETKLPNALDPVADRPEGMDEEVWKGLQLSYEAIRAWYVKHEPKLIFAEEALISEEYQYAGTPDCVWTFPRDIAEYGVKAGEAWLGDYKTGKMLGAKEVAQMASYRTLLRDNKIADVKGALLIHAPTTQPGYMRVVVLDSATLDLGWVLFAAGLDVFAALPQLEGVCE